MSTAILTPETLFLLDICPGLVREYLKLVWPDQGMSGVSVTWSGNVGNAGFILLHCLQFRNVPWPQVLTKTSTIPKHILNIFHNVHGITKHTHALPPPPFTLPPQYTCAPHTHMQPPLSPHTHNPQPSFTCAPHTTHTTQPLTHMCTPPLPPPHTTQPQPRQYKRYLYNL